jgi:DNA-binding LacI/PurR family transcriptional regulator
MARRDTPSARLEDVARAAGVSRATAARALGGYGAVSAAVRTRVAEAAARLGYTPDPVARALGSGNGLRLVVAVAGPTAAELRDPYIDRIVSAAAATAAPHRLGVSLHWVPLRSPADLRHLAADRTVRGVLLVNSTPPLLGEVPDNLRGRVAAVGLGSRTVPSFDIGLGAATSTILTYLLNAGRRRIVMVTGSGWLPSTNHSVAAHRTLMRATGLPTRVVAGDFTAASGRAAAVEALDRWPDTDAVFAGSDAMALGALVALRARGVDVPGDVAVAGFDDIPFAALSAPALTTAGHPVEEIAAAATGAILDRVTPRPVTLFPSELVVRDSA